MSGIPADGSLLVGSIRWDDAAHDVFTFRRLIRFMMFTGFRLAEIVGNGSGEIMFLTYGSLFWCIDNLMIAAPSRAQLLNLRPGQDSAVVFPPRSKPDQWGETHCPFPVRLTYETTELNPALPPYATSSYASACKSPTETVTPSSVMPRGRRILTTTCITF